MNNIVEGEAVEVQEGDAVNLSSVFEQIDGPEQQTQQEAQQEEAINIGQEEELAAIIFTAGQILAMKYPSLANVFTMEKCTGVAQQINPLFVRYGWKINLGGDFALWSNALTAIIVLGMEVRAAIMADVAAAIRKAAEEAAGTR